MVAIPQNTSFPGNVPALSPVVTGFGPFNPATDPPLGSTEHAIGQPHRGARERPGRLIQSNGATYGWNTAFSMYRASHPYGLCSANRWVTNPTDYIINTVATKGTGAGLHPNDVGQQQYADMLSTTLLSQVPPVVPAFTTLQPLGPSVKSRLRAKLLTSATIQAGQAHPAQGQGHDQGPKTGRIGDAGGEHESGVAL